MRRNFGCIAAWSMMASLPVSTLAADDPELSVTLWEKSVNLRGALGYKDNVLLSSSNPEGSAFWLTGLDASVFRVSLDGGPNLTFFLSAEDRRYFTTDALDKEQFLLTQARLDQPFKEVWTASAILQYMYADQVYDASSTEQLFVTLPVISHNFQLAPSLKRALPANSEIELKFTVERQEYEFPLDDYWEVGPQLSYTKKYGNRSEFSVSYTFDHRAYDVRRELDLKSISVPGTSLRYHQHEFEATVNHSWDQQRRWRSRLRLLYELNDDGGTGYYDFVRYRVSKRFGYFAADWNATIEGKILHYDYDRQPVFDGTDIRSTWDYVITGRAQKRVWKQLSIFADVEYELADSNYEFETYNVTTFMGGVDWEF